MKRHFLLALSVLATVLCLPTRSAWAGSLTSGTIVVGGTTGTVNLTAEPGQVTIARTAECRVGECQTLAIPGVGPWSLTAKAVRYIESEALADSGPVPVVVYATPVPGSVPSSIAPPAPKVSQPQSPLAMAWAWLWGPGGAILFFMAWAISEAMANAFPSLAANSLFQLLRMGIKKAEDKNPMPVSSGTPAA